MSSAIGTQVGFVARRSVRRTFRQPAVLVPTIVFPLFLLAVNASGLDSAVSLPGFPGDSYLDFAIVVTFMQGALFAATTGEPSSPPTSRRASSTASSSRRCAPSRSSSASSRARSPSR